VPGGRAGTPVAFPPPRSWHRQVRSEDGSRFFLCHSFCRLSLCYFLGAHHIILGQAWAEGKGELATCRHRADSGQENWTRCTPP